MTNSKWFVLILDMVPCLQITSYASIFSLILLDFYLFVCPSIWISVCVLRVCGLVCLIPSRAVALMLWHSSLGIVHLVRTQDIMKKKFFSYSLIHTSMCAYLGVRNFSFSENFANVLNDSKVKYVSLKIQMIYKSKLYPRFLDLNHWFFKIRLDNFLGHDKP